MDFHTSVPYSPDPNYPLFILLMLTGYKDGVPGNLPEEHNAPWKIMKIVTAILFFPVLQLAIRSGITGDTLDQAINEYSSPYSDIHSLVIPQIQPRSISDIFKQI